MDANLKKILISQPDPKTKKTPYHDVAKKYGVEIVFRPFVRVDPVSAKEFRAQKINLPDYTAVIFTAKTAIDHFFRLCEEFRVNIPEEMRYFCVTKSIAAYLQKYIVFRKRKIFFPTTSKLEDLMPYIHKNNKEYFLLPVSDVHNEDLLKLLDGKKIKYTKAIMYRTVSNNFTSDEVFDYDILLFFSPSGIASLLKNFPNFEQNKTIIGTFGPMTAKTARDAGLRLDIEAPNPQAPSMVAALEQYLKTGLNPIEKQEADFVE
ncbi:MAG: uroporphyrinogen-III synthase [Dysgonamonadaceae bacterium]|jgi:uroporphyrinogen-III synthase|nr:uroporphyrinogen-III synthase [Dysgonamonadaceae bacterium]